VLTKAEIMNALWEAQYGYCEDNQPGDEIHYIDETYNYDAFARSLNRLIEEKLAGAEMVQPETQAQKT
jgi:hypothetical protein